MSKKKSNVWQAVSAASTMGFTLVVCIGLGLFLGMQADSYFHIYPWGILGGALLGAVTGLYAIIRQIMES